MSDSARVPLLDLRPQFQSIRGDVLAAIERVADSQRFILGPEVEGFEREIAALLEVEYAIGVSSGTDALLVALMALGVGPGAEVIMPTYSFFATAGCVSRIGATPVFVDIDPGTLNVDPAALAGAITPATRAILPVHLFGLCADMTPILGAATQAGIPVIEDAAQAIGARYGTRQAGGLGTVACFSFFPSKNLGAFGDAGLVTTNDAALAHEVRLLRMHGMEPKYVHSRIGGNFRLDALQAAILRVKAPHVADWTAARRRNADRYRALFAEFGLTGTVTLPIEPAGFTHVYNQFVIRSARRDALKLHLATRQIETEIYYPLPLHRQPCYLEARRLRSSAVAEGRESEVPKLPHADRAAATSLAIPVYGELTEAQQRHVVASIAEFL